MVNWRLERQWTANICVSPGGKEACNCSILINVLTHDSSIETSKLLDLVAHYNLVVLSLEWYIINIFLFSWLTKVQHKTRIIDSTSN